MSFFSCYINSLYVGLTEYTFLEIKYFTKFKGRGFFGDDTSCKEKQSCFINHLHFVVEE